MKAIVAGAGAMGSAIAYGLNKLGFSVRFVDPVVKEAEFEVLPDLTKVDETDIVVSAAPYHQNLSLANFCANKGWRYCDLGGNPSISESIQRFSDNKLVFTDLGLAPGLSNIIAEAAIAKNKSDNVEIQVGGLPIEPERRLGYSSAFWSLDGLINEYSGMCEIIRNNSVCYVPALSEVEEIDFPDVGKLEAFHTRGALDLSVESMLEKGVKNLTYKTIRFPGHADYVDFLLNECRISHHEFKKAINFACPKSREDMVLIRIKVGNEVRCYLVKHNERFTAMQITTAFPTAAIATLIASGLFDDKQVLNYSDLLPFVDRIDDNLKKIYSNFTNFFDW
jgi:saccharopine dehydrogenase-like NADP-dependent oxidoreductase